MMIRTTVLTTAAAGFALALAAAAPAFAQGATEIPPAPNSAASAPVSPNSLPQDARTMPQGTTGTARMGVMSSTGALTSPPPEPPGVAHANGTYPHPAVPLAGSSPTQSR